MVRAILMATGGYLNGFISTWESLPLWQLIEYIEMVTEINKVKE